MLLKNHSQVSLMVKIMIVWNSVGKMRPETVYVYTTKSQDFCASESDTD